MTTNDNTSPSRGVVLGALGVVFGDIGTSPLYTLRLSLDSIGGSTAVEDVYGVISLMAWSLIFVVTIKYIFVLMRAHNRGEGGVMALLALALRARHLIRGQRTIVMTAGLLGAALFFADGLITPAISVLSAVEGLKVATPFLEPVVLPIAAAILVGLFLIQKQGTERVGGLFGPILLIWFSTLGVLGIKGILEHPEMLLALNPLYGLSFIAHHQFAAFIALGSIVLTVTGCEALYADMGHFGARSIRIAWLTIVLPGLLLNYLGQGAHVLADPAAIANPFYLLAPDWALYPLIALATMATIIASQSVISGAFSLAQQAVQLGYLPRFQILHTSESTRGQVYVPRVNWIMLALVLMLVATFHNSDALAGAYGLAVTGTMTCTTILGFIVFATRRGDRPARVAMLFIPLILIDIAFLSSTFLKFFEGGFLPVIIGVGLFLAMQTWARGRGVMSRRRGSMRIPQDSFLAGLDARGIPRTTGTAVFLTEEKDAIPHSLLHNLKHNRVLHEVVVLLSFVTEDVPHVKYNERASLAELGHGFWRLIVKHGFMDEPNVSQALRLAEPLGLKIAPHDASFFVGRQKLVRATQSPLPRWREAIFITLAQTAESATDYFRVPADRVVELGTQVEV
jgi:KUP system potassium uptake protein